MWSHHRVYRYPMSLWCEARQTPLGGEPQSVDGATRNVPPPPACVRAPCRTRESLQGMGRRVERRQGRPAPKSPRPCRQSDGAEESACGNATYMAKALRERGGTRDQG